jgi:hypothetical protein
MPSQDGVIRAFRDEFVALRALADKATAQVDDDRFFAQLDSEANSVALLMKHIGGNLRSRWTDVFTTDGEKPDRRRDEEFERVDSESRKTVEAVWNAGWAAVLETLDGLEDGDLTRTVAIRRETMPLSRALTRSLAHTAGHVHQIVLLSKHWGGSSWRTLSIPRRRSEDAGSRQDH